MPETVSLAIEVGVPVITVILGALIGRLLKKVDSLERGLARARDAQTTQGNNLGTSIDKVERSLIAELHRIETTGDKALAEFEIRVQKDFVSQPALLQIMSSLDKTLTALSEVIKENQKETRISIDGLKNETRENLNALNGRIDSMLGVTRK